MFKVGKSILNTNTFLASTILYKELLLKWCVIIKLNLNQQKNNSFTY